MFALGDISKFEGEKEKYKILKPLWNVITDYLVVFLAVMSIVFAGMQVTSGSFQCLAAVDCPGISRSNKSSSLLSNIKHRNVCKTFYSSQKTNIIKRTDVVTDLKSSFQYTNFVNSECSKSTIPHFLAYFWFAIFVQAFVLIVLNNLWLKLPNTASVIEHFVALVMECYVSPFPNFVSKPARFNKRAKDHADGRLPDSNGIEMVTLVPDNNVNQPHEFNNISDDPASRHADGQGRDSYSIEMATLVDPENNVNQPHESNNISDDSARHHAGDRGRDGNGIEMATLVDPDNNVNQPHKSNNISDDPARHHADDQGRDGNGIEMATPVPDNSGNQPHEVNYTSDDPARHYTDDQQGGSNGTETAKLLLDNSGNQPHESDNISGDPSRRLADDQPRDSNDIEMPENPASDNDGNQPYDFNILEDPATISVVKTLYEKVHTFKEGVESSQKIWRLYLLQSILQASFAIASFVFDIYFMKDLKGTMTCKVTQHIPVTHDYFICSHYLAPTYVWGLKVVYFPALGFALAIFIFTIAWTFKRRGKNGFKYDFKEKRLPSLVGKKTDDIRPVDKDCGFLLHLLHAYNKLYVVRFAHFLSEENKKKFQIFQARNYALKERTLKGRRQLYEESERIPVECKEVLYGGPYEYDLRRSRPSSLSC